MAVGGRWGADRNEIAMSTSLCHSDCQTVKCISYSKLQNQIKNEIKWRELCRPHRTGVRGQFLKGREDLRTAPGPWLALINCPFMTALWQRQRCLPRYTAPLCPGKSLVTITAHAWGRQTCPSPSWAELVLREEPGPPSRPRAHPAPSFRRAGGRACRGQTQGALAKVQGN